MKARMAVLWMVAVALVGVCPVARGGDVSCDNLTVTNDITQTSSGGTVSFMGDVGVGTASPDRELHVSGEIEVDEIYFDNNEVALGHGTNSNCRFSGSSAGSLNSGNTVIGLGWNAAYDNSGGDVNALGGQSASGNSGNYVNAFGKAAASQNSGTYVNALGHSASKMSSGGRVNALGYFAAYTNSGDYLNAMGSSAAWGNSADHVNGLGNCAARGNSGSDVNAFGSNAGDGASGSYCNYLGSQAGDNNANSYVNIIGRWLDSAPWTNRAPKESTWLSGDLYLYDPPWSWGDTTGNKLTFESGATIQGSSTNICLTSGNVGVGTSSPTETLHVAGTGKFEQGITYVAALGDVPMDIYTNMP